MTENSDRIERTIELLLYAPLGIGLFLKDTAPQFVDMFVSRGPRRDRPPPRRGPTARHDRAQPRPGRDGIRTADRARACRADRRRRAPHGGGPARLVRADGAAPRRPSPAAHPTRRGPSPRPLAEAAPAPAPAPGYTAPAASTVPAPKVDVGSSKTNGGPLGNGDGTESAELPIPGYDALSASQVVQRLVGLSADELAAVHAYEAAHRQRRTIIGKIEQLAG